MRRELGSIRVWPKAEGLTRWLSGKETTCQAGGASPIPGWDDPLEEEKAVHSSILAWRIPWTEEPGRLQSMESQESDGNYRVNNQPTNQQKAPF